MTNSDHGKNVRHSNRLEGSVVAITGAGSGNGRASALRTGREGASLYISDINAELLENTLGDLKSEGIDAAGGIFDAANIDDAPRLISAITDAYGRIDVLVNNAAILGPLEPVGWDDVDTWRLTLEIDLIGSYLMLHKVLPIMVEQRRGKVINVASPNAVRYESWLTAYGVSKAGLVRLTTGTAAQTTQYGIDVNVVDVVGYTDLAKEVGNRPEADVLAAEYWRRRAEIGVVLKPDVNVPLMLWLASSESDGFTGRYVRWTMNLKDLKAAKEHIIASPTALRPMFEFPKYIGETETARWYASESAKVMAQVESEFAGHSNE